METSKETLYRGVYYVKSSWVYRLNGSQVGGFSSPRAAARALSKAGGGPIAQRPPGKTVSVMTSDVNVEDPVSRYQCVFYYKARNTFRAKANDVWVGDFPEDETAAAAVVKHLRGLGQKSSLQELLVDPDGDGFHNQKKAWSGVGCPPQ